MKLPVMSGRDLIKLLVKHGFAIRRKKGSHVILKKVNKYNRIVVVPDHKEVDPGTLLEILRQAGLKKTDLV